MKQMTLLLVTIATNVLGQYMMKRGMGDVGRVGGDLTDILGSLMRAFTNPFVVAGVAAYAFGSIFWLMLLSRVDLSYAYPVLSLGYVMITLVSALLLGENVTAMRWSGVLVICLGVFLIARSA